MVMKQIWMRLLLNALLGGGYITIILLMIRWVCSGSLGIAAFFVPVAILAVMVLAWTVLDRKKDMTVKRYERKTTIEWIQ